MRQERRKRQEEEDDEERRGGEEREGIGRGRRGWTGRRGEE